jgi:hypothetical protein
MRRLVRFVGPMRPQQSSVAGQPPDPATLPPPDALSAEAPQASNADGLSLPGPASSSASVAAQSTQQGSPTQTAG